ncbi:hypothetical protein R1flu_021921 [Riccia fluitans]|uniref:Uncharacterized protein n=1 Tax=Riccia fluitans TaxID=41844 RepID=A0ABD1ZQY7_9MARC
MAERYAPIVRFHPDEQYFMCTVDWYLQRGTLLGPNGYSKVSPSVADLPIGSKDDGKTGKYQLQMTDEAKKGDLSTARNYVRAYWQTGKPYFDLQYWFCYGYNGAGTLHVSGISSADVSLAPLGEHWIDWEMMSLRIKIKTQQVVGVYLSQHGGGQLITDLSLFQRQKDQFIVYASKNGHAVYARSGTNPTNSGDGGVVSWYLRNDTADGGRSFNSAGRLDVVSVNYLSTFVEPRWLQFPYRYGIGSDTHVTVEAVSSIIAALLGPFAWLQSLLSPTILAEAILPRIKFDDLKGVYGPQTQDYWNSWFIPDFVITTGYTGWNTNGNTPPSIAFFKGKYHVFFQDHNGNGMMHIESPDGFIWSKPKSFYTGFNGSGGPYAIVYQNTLRVYFRDGSGNGLLHIQSADGETWTPAPNWYMGINIDSQPTAAVLNGTLCVVGVDHGGNGIMYALQKNLEGTSAHGYSGWNTNGNVPPCAVAFKNAFHCFFQDHNGGGIMHITSADGTNWSKAKTFYTGYNTSAGPGAVVFDDQIYIYFRDGSGNGILVIRSSDGENFTPTTSWYTGLNCDSSPRIATADDNQSQCLVATDHNGNGVMRAVILPW